MTDAQPIIEILSGVAALLGLIGIPAAVVVAPISSILSGIFGLKGKK
jgi:hypothetical protein